MCCVCKGCSATTITGQIIDLCWRKVIKCRNFHYSWLNEKKLNCSSYWQGCHNINTYFCFVCITYLRDDLFKGVTQLLVYNDWSFIEWFLSKTWMFWAERFLDVCWSSFVFMVSVIKIVHRNLFLAQTESDISSLSSIFQLYEMGRQKSRRKHDRHFQSIREIFYCSQAGSHHQLDLRDISAQSADNYRLRSVVTL